MKTPGSRLLTAFFVLISCLSSAQFSQPYLRKLGKNEGLTGSLVLAMVQDSRNLYWIGTLNGLQLFDGKTFRKYPLPFFQKGISGSNSISVLLPENDSTLLVAHYQGIARFNLYSRTFDYIPLPKESPSQTLAFSSLFRDENGNIWASSFELGLIRYHPEKNAFEKAGDQRFQQLKRVKGPLPAGNGNLLVFHKEGCNLFNLKANRLATQTEIPAEFSWINDPCFKGEIYDLFNDEHFVYAQVWNFDKVAYDFIRYDKRTSTHSLCDIRTIAGRRFFMDSGNNLWAYGDGIDVILAGSGEIIPFRENIKEGKLLDFSMCHRMFEDKENNVWLCTNSGLFVFNRHDRNFSICNDTDDKGYVKHTYNCIEECADKTVLAGTFGEGLLMLDEQLKLKEIIDFKKKTDDPHFNLLWCIRETKDAGTVWIGCQRGRLIRWNRTSGTFDFFNDSAFDQKTIMSITEDEQGNVFFGTNGGTVIKKEKSSQEFRRIYESALLAARTAAGTITSLFASGTDLYIGTSYDGIIRMNISSGSSEHYKMSMTDGSALKSNNVFCLLPDDEKGFFAGTSNGLGYFDYAERKFSFYTLYDGLPFSNIYDMVKIGNNKMIATTSDGLYKINWNQRSFERIDKNGNLYKGFNSVCLKRTGEELLLVDDEFFYRLPVYEEAKKELPPSWIYTISSFGRSFPLKNGQTAVMFDKDHNTVNIEFGASTFKYYNSIDYYYMLEGLDQDWLPAGNNRVITYNDLKGGDYIFRLKCVFQEDKNSVQELQAAFSIKKHFNQTAWFYLLLLALICLLFYLIYRIRVNKLLAIEKIRFDLSKDLHDDMGSTLSTINILSVMAENKMHEDTSQSRDYLKRINAISQEMMQSMDDIVWSINPVNDTMEKVVIRMREFAAGMLEPLDISLTFEADNAVNSIGTKMKWRRDFFLIFKEAVNNSAKYSQCRHVRIRINITNRNLVLEITDDGIGFNTEGPVTGNGLANMRKRAQAIGAELNIESTPGTGTRIALTIPLNKL